MAKTKLSEKRKTPSPIQAFLAFVEAHADQDLNQEDSDRLFDLDVAAGAECKKRGIEVPKSDSKRCTTYMKLPYYEKSIYEYPGNLDLNADPNVPDHWPLIVDPDPDWLNWLRAMVRNLREAKPESPGSRRSSIAGKIESLKRELKDHLIAARDFAYSTKEEKGAADLLPRPLKNELAKRVGIKPYDVTRCLQDPEAAELKLYWEIADDLDRIMSFKSL